MRQDGSAEFISASLNEVHPIHIFSRQRAENYVKEHATASCNIFIIFPHLSSLAAYFFLCYHKGQEGAP